MSKADEAAMLRALQHIEMRRAGWVPKPVEDPPRRKKKPRDQRGFVDPRQMRLPGID